MGGRISSPLGEEGEQSLFRGSKKVQARQGLQGTGEDLYSVTYERPSSDWGGRTASRLKKVATSDPGVLRPKVLSSVAGKCDGSAITMEKRATYCCA